MITQTLGLEHLFPHESDNARKPTTPLRSIIPPARPVSSARQPDEMTLRSMKRKSSVSVQRPHAGHRNGKRQRTERLYRYARLLVKNALVRTPESMISELLKGTRR
jgi:hypothetical protein